ncbi:MAG: hypothetical protein MZW92_34800 [Comamonadaceae bacterium]|nr:hypothetical protein [Comamonadaceae bacterium]
MSRDNLDSMQVPNVASGTLPGLEALGIRATGTGGGRAGLPRRRRPAAAADDRLRAPARAAPEHAARSDGAARMALQLVIGNKNYSSWSMRPWVLMRQLGIAVRRGQAALRLRRRTRPFRRAVAALSPAGRVPVLVRRRLRGVGLAGHRRVRWHERFPARGVWPADAAAARPRAQRLRRDARRLRRAAPATAR